MSHAYSSLSRRDFLKLSALGLGALAFSPQKWGWAAEPRPLALPEFPQAELLGRNCAADTNLGGGKIELRVRPDVNAAVVRDVYRDEVFPWIREVVADSVSYDVPSQRWVETPEGYVRARYLQPCRNLPNVPLTAMPEGKSGFWAEVTVPYVDLIVDNPAPVSGWVRDHVYYNLQPRLYYQQVMWIDQIRVLDDGSVQYRVNERYGNPGDLFWADGAAFRPLTEDDLAPIHPDVDPATKKIVVNLTYQTLSCFEEEREVYFCRVSTGAGDGSTPLGEHAVWRKLISVRMANTSENTSYDLPGISWTTLFSGTGVAIHGTTSHNDFGFPRSHGCVNCRPEDAKWIFRWCLPQVPLEPGDVQWSDWVKGSTHVFVVDTLF